MSFDLMIHRSIKVVSVNNIFFIIVFKCLFITCIYILRKCTLTPFIILGEIINRLDKKLDDAVNRASLSDVRKFLEEGADMEYQDAFGCTAMSKWGQSGVTPFIHFLFHSSESVSFFVRVNFKGSVC